MPFRFYIDDQLVNQPANDKALTTTIKYDTELSALLVTQDAKLQWFNKNDLASGETSAYTYLMSVMADSVCTEATLRIYDEVSEQETYLLYTGIIKIPSIEIDEQNISISTTVQDNSFYSYINNNREVKVLLTADQTKTKFPLTQISKYSIDLFNSNGCAYGSTVGALYHGFHIVDALDLIVRAISDNNVSVQSSYLSALDPIPMLLKGQDIINPYTIFPGAEEPVYEISFIDIYRELNKIFNLNFYIDIADPENPILRIEDIGTFYDGTTIYDFNLDDIKELKTTVNLQNYYSTVDVGSQKLTDGTLSLYTFSEGTSYFGWKQESFHPIGQCNTNNTLDLVNEWVLSNNVIQETAILGATAYIDDYFLIECSNVDDVAFTADAYQYDYFGQGGCYYNFGMNNITKVNRHSGKFETQFGSFLSIGVDGFRALLGDAANQDIPYVTAPASNPNFIPLNGITVDSEFVNETTEGGYDGGNNYNNVTFEYVVPADGVYSFHQRLIFTISGCTANEIFQVGNTITLYDQFSVQKAAGGDGANYSGVNVNTQHILDVTFVCDCVAGDIVKANYDLFYDPNQAGNGQNPRTLNMEYTSYFECNGTPDSGITIEGNTKLRKFIHEFDYSIPESDWRNIVQNVNSAMTFTKDGETRFGWIHNMIHDHQTGATKVKLISDNAIITEP